MCNAIKMYMSQYRVYLAIGLAVAVFSAGWAGAWKIQGARVAEKEADLAVYSQANAANKKTIEQLRADAETSAKTCKKLLDRQRQTEKKNREIDALTTMGGAENVALDASADVDPVLNGLNRMFVDMPEPSGN